MLASVLLFVVVAMVVRSLIGLPSKLRMVGAALLLGMPALGGVVMFAVAKGSSAMTTERDMYAAAGTIAGWILGAVLLHLLGGRSQGDTPD